MTSSSRASQSGKKPGKIPTIWELKANLWEFRLGRTKFHLWDRGGAGSWNSHGMIQRSRCEERTDGRFPCGFAAHPRGIQSHYPDFFLHLFFGMWMFPWWIFLGFPAEFWDVNGDFFFFPRIQANLKKFMEYVQMLNSEKVCRLLEKGLDPNFHDPDTGGEFRLFLWIRELFRTNIPSSFPEFLQDFLWKCFPHSPGRFLGGFYGTIPAFRGILGMCRSSGTALPFPVPAGVCWDGIPRYSRGWRVWNVFPSRSRVVSDPGLFRPPLDEGIGISW